MARDKIVLDEFIDIVNENDEIQSRMLRSDAEADDIKYRRCVLIFVRCATNGTFAILRRSSDKVYLPNHWSIVGGGVQSGEVYDQACAREVQEETNIDILQFPHRSLGLITPDYGHGSLFKMVYEVVVEDPSVLRFNKEEFSELLWLDPRQIREKGTSDLVVPDLLWLIKSFYQINI